MPWQLLLWRYGSRCLGEASLAGDSAIGDDFVLDRRRPLKKKDLKKRRRPCPVHKENYNRCKPPSSSEILLLSDFHESLKNDPVQ